MNTILLTKELSPRQAFERQALACVCVRPFINDIKSRTCKKCEKYMEEIAFAYDGKEMRFVHFSENCAKKFLETAFKPYGVFLLDRDSGLCWIYWDRKEYNPERKNEARTLEKVESAKFYGMAEFIKNRSVFPFSESDDHTVNIWKELLACKYQENNRACYFCANITKTMVIVNVDNAKGDVHLYCSDCICKQDLSFHRFVFGYNTETWKSTVKFLDILVESKCLGPVIESIDKELLSKN